ncbi:MAG: efflux RND transporter periplasmic adaptor subunit [Dehalococcoidia bacterium]|nr:efflux RND transporter periplasmic adaptor subunit [Dehalococcoidia bacterium]MDD5493160.1 efflux RND transporter periplasmic adaptor subunit [Dehalococcoidia bacterium]
MSKRLMLTITFFSLLAVVLPSCAQQQKTILPGQTATVTRGDLILSVSSDGNLDMPNEVKLKFGTPGTVKEIPAENIKGKPVRAGTLLARLDNTTQLLSVQAAQYSLELAINNVVQTCCGTRYPTFYSLATALMRFEQAQSELADARTDLLAVNYSQAASNLSLAGYDLTAVRSVYADPRLDAIQTQYDDLNQPVSNYPQLQSIVSLLDAQIASLVNVRKLLEAGDYEACQTMLNSLQADLEEVHTTVKSNSRLPGAYTYPDTSTSLAISRQVLDALADIETMLYDPALDRVKASEKLRMAQHDLQMANMILNESETIYRAGLNPQTLRTYNINIETAWINLEKAKQELLKTEIVAPFDGTVVAVDVKVNDQLSQFDYSSKTAVHLVDTGTIRMKGVVDEIDITQVSVGQEAILTVDAVPDQKFKGHVTFISPFGMLQSGVVNFPIEIYFDKDENIRLLRGGLTATADIVIGQRESVLIVPNRSIKGLAGDYWVEVVIDADKALTEKIQVQIGMQNKKSTEIISGLEEGDLVLTETIK